MKLTQKDVKTLKLPPGKTDKIFFDDSVPGFGLRIRAGGSRTWIFQYMPRGGGTEQRMSLGSAKLISLDRARTATAKSTTTRLSSKSEAPAIFTSSFGGAGPQGNAPPSGPEDGADVRIPH